MTKEITGVVTQHPDLKGGDYIATWSVGKSNGAGQFATKEQAWEFIKASIDSALTEAEETNEG